MNVRSARRAWGAGVALVPMSLLADAELSERTRLVYAIMSGLIDQGRAPDLRMVARFVGCQQRSVEKSIDELAERGHISVHQTGDGDDVRIILRDGVDPLPVAQTTARAHVGGKAIDEDEQAMAHAVLEEFNRQAGTRYSITTEKWLKMVVARMRKHPDLSLEDYSAVIEGLVQGPRWWDPSDEGAPATPNMIFGNDAQFDRCLSRATATGGNGEWSARQMLDAADFLATTQEDSWQQIEAGSA
jgi:hypothetical protein